MNPSLLNRRPQPGNLVMPRHSTVMRVVFLLILVVAATAPLHAAVRNAHKQATYTNPVTADGHPIHMGDPFVFRADGEYFLTGSTSVHEGFQMYQSPDLVHWIYIGWALKRTPKFWADDLFWAPEIRFYRGKYYIVYSGHVRGSNPPRLLLGLAVSDHPQGPYRNLHGPWFNAGYSAIDGDILIDHDGTPYLYFSRNGAQDGYAYGKIYGVQLERDLSKPIGKPVELMEASQPWERVNWAHNRCNEGPTVFRHGKKYYMTYSANDTSSPNYGIGYATANHPLGPWKKSDANPVLATNKAIGASGPGHNSLVLSPDGKEMFIVYHTHADASHPSMDRVVNINRVHISASGILTVDGPTRSPQPMPSGTAQ